MDVIGWWSALCLLVAGMPVDAEWRWRVVLGAIDSRREQAYESADPALLEQVYTRDSSLLAADTRVLDGYVDRGLRVRGLGMRVHSLVVGDVSADTVVISIVDQLEGVRVRSAGAAWRDLPSDERSARTLVLRYENDAWRIASIRPADPYE